MSKLNDSEIRGVIDPLCDAFDSAWATGRRPAIEDAIEQSSDEVRVTLFPLPLVPRPCVGCGYPGRKLIKAAAGVRKLPGRFVEHPGQQHPLFQFLRLHHSR